MGLIEFVGLLAVLQLATFVVLVVSWREGARRMARQDAVLWKICVRLGHYEDARKEWSYRG